MDGVEVELGPGLKSWGSEGYGRFCGDLRNASGRLSLEHGHVLLC